MKERRRWRDLDPRQRRWVLVAGAVQLSLAAADEAEKEEA